MGQNNFIKIAYIVAFLVLAGYSCWATEHSLHLLFPLVPEVFVWGVTIAFFMVASYATKLIMDALSEDFVENKKTKFWGGLLLLVVFWLLASMPTNTHTFFYNHEIGNVVLQDLNTTGTYLEQIANKENTDTAYYELKAKVDAERKLMTDEFNGKGPSHKKGNGENVASHLREINNLIGCEIPVNENYNVHDISILNQYDQAINKELKILQEKKYQVSSEASRKAKEDISNINQMDSAINQMVYVGNIDEDLIKQTEGVLQIGYSDVKNSNQYVRFNNDADKEKYTADNLETDTKRMLSVIDVWLDFLGGKYPASFVFYILISILVDIAAFIFFDLAFK